MPGYTLVDLFTSYRFDSGFEIGATVVNLFDTDYTPAYHADCSVWSRDTDKLLRQQSSNCSDCGPGRTLLLTTKAQF